MDVLKSFYSNFISFFGTNLLTQCPVPVAVFSLFFTLQEIDIKRSPKAAKLLEDFVGQKTSSGPRKHLGGASRGAAPTRTRPGGLCPPQGTPQVLLWPTGCLLVYKNSIKSFAAFGLHLVLISCDVKNKQKTTTGTGHYVNRLVPKNDIKLL